MFAEICDTESRRQLTLPHLAWLVLAAAALFPLLIVSGSSQVQLNPPDWLSADQPSAVAVADGCGQVDVYLSPEVPVTLLLSNLGSSNQSSMINVTAEFLRTPPRYRPEPLSTSRGDTPDVGIPSSRSVTRTDTNHSQVAGDPPGKRGFWMHVTSQPLEDPDGYRQVQGQLAAVGKRVQVYVDASLLRKDGLPRPFANAARDVMARLEQDILPTIGSHIGPVHDMDRDGRLTVLMTPWLGRLRGGETQVRGFVRSSDFRNEVAPPFSNRGDILYLNSDLPGHSGLQTLLLHEMAHAALFSVPQMQRSSREFEWDDWLNEGLAHLIERSRGAGGDWSNVDYRVAQYWQEPAAAPLLVSDYYRCGRWRDHGCRGATYLFLDWCREEYSRHGRADFIPALVATGKAGIAAVTDVLGRDFDDLYRDWTISGARSRLMAGGNPRVGRFSASGPRTAELRVADGATGSWMIAGTATQWVELRTSQAGWYRLLLAGDPHERWQATMLKESPRPAVALKAAWLMTGATNSDTLSISGWGDLMPDWQIERVCCEQIDEVHPYTRQWSSDGLRLRPGQREFALTLPKDDLQTAMIKVQFQRADGRSFWAWCDVPVPPSVQHSTLRWSKGAAQSTN